MIGLGILKTIFGSGDVISKGMDLIDDAWTTDEEQRESKTNAKTALLKAYAPFKVAQRYLAIMFTGVYLLTYAMVMGMTLWGSDPNLITNVKVVISEFNIDFIMGTIVLFYFGGGTIESWNNRGAKNK